MSGHSKFANIKHKKNLNDSKRAKTFVKVAKEINTALAKGGSNIKNNKALLNAIAKAKALNMPKNHYLNLIKNFDSKKNTAQNLVLYCGFGPFKTAFLLWCLDENKNRVIANLKSYFDKHNGSLVNKNAVLNYFNFQGQLKFTSSLKNEELVLETILEYEIIDFENKNSYYLISYEPKNKARIEDYILENKKTISVVSNKIEYFPKQKLNLSKENFLKIQKLLLRLDNDEDIVKYIHNF